MSRLASDTSMRLQVVSLDKAQRPNASCSSNKCKYTANILSYYAALCMVHTGNLLAALMLAANSRAVE